MDPIKPLDAVSQLLRQRMTEKAGRVDAKTTTGTQSAKASAGGHVRESVIVLRRRVKDALAELDYVQPDQRRKAMRVFVEHVLAWEFGDQVLNDPRFAALADEVQQMLGSDVDALLRALDRD